MCVKYKILSYKKTKNYFKIISFESKALITFFDTYNIFYYIVYLI